MVAASLSNTAELSEAVVADEPEDEDHAHDKAERKLYHIVRAIHREQTRWRV